MPTRRGFHITRVRQSVCPKPPLRKHTSAPDEPTTGSEHKRPPLSSGTWVGNHTFRCPRSTHTSFQGPPHMGGRGAGAEARARGAQESHGTEGGAGHGRRGKGKAPCQVLGAQAGPTRGQTGHLPRRVGEGWGRSDGRDRGRHRRRRSRRSSRRREGGRRKQAGSEAPRRRRAGENDHGKNSSCYRSRADTGLLREAPGPAAALSRG